MEEIKLKGLNESIYCDTCENGLKVYMWVKKTVNTYYATLSVKYGSIFNEFKLGSKTYRTPKGVAHFLEHVKFNEDKDTTAHDYYFKTGCDTNAFTTFDYTNYQVLGSEDAPKNIVHLLDFVQNDFFTKNIVNNEKGIITEEAKMGEDDPYTVMLFKHLENIFHTYEHKYVITGSPDEIKKITLEDIKLVFDNFYHPENMFLVVTGNFNPYEVMDTIKENQNKKEFPKFKNPQRIINKESRKVKKEREDINLNVTSRKIKIGLKIARNSLKDYDEIHIKALLSIILKANFGITSDFRNELLEKEIMNNMSYMSEVFDDYYVVMFTIDSKYTDEILKLFQDKLNNLMIDEKTFQRIKNANVASLILEFEDVELVNSVIQNDILRYGKIIDNLKEIYENITYDDVVNFLNVLDIKNQSILVLNPIE